MKRLLLLLLFVGIALLPLLPAPDADAGTMWTIFPGRFHLLLLHFPVVLVLLLVLLTIGQEVWRWVIPANLSLWLWGMTLAGCLFTVLAGYLLYRSGEYQGVLVRNHLWGGVLLMQSLIGAFYFRFISEPGKWQRNLQNSLVILAGGLVIYTSHQGGSLTHGPGFLTEYAPELTGQQAAAVERKPMEELLVFQDLIMPVLDRRCLSCHNEYKTKGDLLMTSHAALSRGGKSGKPMLVAGQPEASELFVRIHLPPEDDDHMPPPEKPGLTADEIELIEWWISEGADPEMILGQGPDTPEGQALITRYLPTLYQAERLRERREKEQAALLAELTEQLHPLGLTAEPDAVSPGFFAIAMMMPPRPVNDETLSALLPYATLFSKVSLPGALITDDGLYDLARFSSLRELYLPKTCIKGPGLVYLQSLPELEVLNLSFTLLDDAGALNLLYLDQVDRVFVYGTEVQQNVLEALEANLSGTELLQMEGPYF